jgi:hypothetical protein
LSARPNALEVPTNVALGEDNNQLRLRDHEVGYHYRFSVSTQLAAPKRSYKISGNDNGDVITSISGPRGPHRRLAAATCLAESLEGNPRFVREGFRGAVNRGSTGDQ